MSPRTRTALRWTKRIALGFAGLIALAIAGALIFLHTDYGREVVREQVEAKLADTFVGGARVGKIEGSPFSELVLNDLVINDAEGHPAITVKRVAIEISLLPLVRQEANVTSLVASDIEVDLRRDANGELLVGRMLKPAKSSGWSVDLGHLEVHRAHVRIAMPDEPIDIDGIEMLGRATIPAGGAIATSVGLRAVWRQKRAPILVDAVARVNEGIITLHSLSAVAGGVRVTGDSLQIAPAAKLIDGRITIDAPRDEVAKLAPSVQLPDDVSATIVARSGTPLSHVRVTGRLGATHGQVLAGIDLANLHAIGVVTTDAVDLPKLTQGKLSGTGGAMIAFDGAMHEQPAATGVVTAWGSVAELPHLRSAIAFTTDGERTAARVAVAGPAVHAAISADITRKGERITLDRSTVIASTTNPHAASGGRAPVRGALDVRLAAHGTLAPQPDLAVSGTVKGRALRAQDLSASSVDIAIEATGLPREPRGKAEVKIEDLVRGDMQLGQLQVTAANQPDGTLAVAVRSRPKLAAWLVDIDAVVSPPKPREQTWTVDIVKHRVRAGDDGEWTGTTGHFEIGPGHYAIENFASTNARGQFLLSASIAPHHFDIDLAVNQQRVGLARVTANIDAPVEFTSAEAWKRVPRSALREGTIELQNIDLQALGKLLGRPDLCGRIDGALAFGSAASSGSIDLIGIVSAPTAKLGRLDAGLEVSSEGDELTPRLIGNFAGLGRFQATARITMPERPFSLASWQAARENALRGANLVVDEIALEPGVLDRFGITSALRGRVKIAGQVGEGGRDASFTVDVTQLRGDPIVRPIDAHLKATLDNSGGSATVSVTSGNVTLLDVKGEVPVTIDQVLADPGMLARAAFTATGTIPDAPAASILAVFGRQEMKAGTIGGTITAKGTLAAPSVTAKITGTGLQVLPGPQNRAVKMLDSLVVDASYTNGVAKAHVKGTQQGGYLDMVASADPKRLATGSLTVKAQSFDLQPLLVFAPGPTGAARGRLDADLTVNGLDPAKARVAGRLHLTKARIPIAPQVGTLRKASIDIVIGANSMTINADGKLGAGTVKVESKFVLAGAQPTSGEAKVTLRKVSPIGTVEPTIDADATATLRRRTDQWIADILIKNATIKVPQQRGEALKPVGAPSDMIFATGEKVTDRPLAKAPPQHARLIANVTFEPTHVESGEVRGLIKGKLRLSADERTVGIEGTIEGVRGELELFGRRYDVDRAAIVFDGTTDPLLDLRITHDFPDVTTATQVRGRLSKPDLLMSSDPPIYSQSQLLGFLLGGEPNGDPQQGSAREVATNAGASFIANRIGGYVKRALPIDIDVLRYEAATASESAAVTVGSWLTQSLFVAYRRRLESRPDENANELEVEYWLSRRVMLEGATGDRAVTGLDLLWRKRY